METENDIDLFDSCFEYVIFKIDQDEKQIESFDSDTLFMNIYLFYCFSRYLSPYYVWDQKALRRLKQNIIIKWPKNDFCNVYLFIELLTRGSVDVDPTGYFWHSEKYFEYLLKIKDQLDLISYKSVFKAKKRKCIR